MSIKNLYPKVRPQIIYNVINGRPELPAASSFSRASEGTYVDAGGIIRTAAVDGPRFNHDPITGEFLGLMLEKEQTNGYPSNTDYVRENWNTRRCDPEPSANTIAPDGSNTAWIFPNDAVDRLQANSAFGVTTGQICVSFFAKNMPGSYSGTVRATVGYNPAPLRDIYDFNTETVNGAWGVEKYRDGWVRLWSTFKYANNSTFIIRLDSYDDDSTGILTPGCNGIAFWGFQVQAGESNVTSGDPTFYPGSLIITSGSAVTREAEAFSLTSSSNFDGGFSLLLDSDTITDDFIYKIKASGTTIAELSNAGGTLDWNINGQSAASNGDYPQIGAVQPGRVRTVSSFGAADGETQLNYLYTEGLSFPTNAIVGTGADEVEFGQGQTFKAVYLWNGQLSNIEAVSVIKGKYNIVANEPIKADSYSFVYNTDATNIGETSITLPYIVPIVSMRVYWGDGNNQRYEQGVTPSHTYPYPGQYRIQIVADDGFDSVRLADLTDAITRVDQWAPQHRVGASGTGFTGNELNNILDNQTSNAKIPPFKYSGITEMTGSFRENRNAACNGWDYVATNIEDCVSLTSTYSRASVFNSTEEERASFPQLQTSSKLIKCTGVFSNCNLKGFKKPNGDSTNKPFTDTTGVTDFTYVVYNNQLTDLVLDLQSCITLKAAFYANNFETFPDMDFSNVEIFDSAFSSNTLMTSFPLLNFSSATNISYAWQGCSALTSFPLITTSQVTTFQSAWQDCSALTSFPALDFSSATKILGAWDGTGLTSFRRFDFPLVTNANSSWRDCDNLASFPINTTFPVCTSFSNTWRGCNTFTQFPALAFPSAKTFQGAWRGCINLSTFPDDNSQDMFNSTGTLSSNSFADTWSGCALTAQSIKNILVSLDANGASNIELGIGDGTNAGKSTWNAAAVAAFDSLESKGWTITYNA